MAVVLVGGAVASHIRDGRGFAASQCAPEQRCGGVWDTAKAAFGGDEVGVDGVAG